MGRCRSHAILLDRWGCKVFCPPVRHGDCRWVPSCFCGQLWANLEIGSCHVCVWADSYSHSEGRSSAYYFYAMWTDTLFGRCQKSDSQTNFQAMAGASIYSIPRPLGWTINIRANRTVPCYGWTAKCTDCGRCAYGSDRRTDTDCADHAHFTCGTTGAITFCILQECHHLSGHRIHEREAEKDGTVGSTSFRGTFGDCSNRTLCRWRLWLSSFGYPILGFSYFMERHCSTIRRTFAPWVSWKDRCSHLWLHWHSPAIV